MSRAVVIGGVLAAAVVTWVVLLHLPWYQGAVITDVPLYRDVGEAMASGDIPYRDIELEYPPLAAALFWVGALLPVGYTVAFSTLMLACLCLTAVAGLLTAEALGLGERRSAAVGLGVALSPLLLGSLAETRFDLALAAALGWAFWALATGRQRTGWLLLGVGVLLKLVPLILVPVVVIHGIHRHGGRATAKAAGLGAGLVALVMAPFALIAPSGLWESFSYHLDRPLQLESTAAAYMLSLHALADIPLTVETSFGSQNLIGEGPRALAAITSGALVLVVLAIGTVMAMGIRDARPPGADRLLLAAAAATIAATLVCGKVLSPQFMVWLLPVGLLVAGRYGRGAFVATLAAMGLTLAYFPRAYWDLVALDTVPITLLVARDAVLIALLAMAWPRPSIAHPARERARAERGSAPIPARHLVD